MLIRPISTYRRWRPWTQINSAEAAHRSDALAVGLAAGCEGQRITVASYHAPPGVAYHEKKPAQAVQFARWLAEIIGPVLVGGDFNTPEIDHRPCLNTHAGTRAAQTCVCGLRVYAATPIEVFDKSRAHVSQEAALDPRPALPQSVYRVVQILLALVKVGVLLMLLVLGTRLLGSWA